MPQLMHCIRASTQKENRLNLHYLKLIIGLKSNAIVVYYMKLFKVVATWNMLRRRCFRL